MERQEAESLGDVLRRTLEQQGMTGRLYEARAISIWPLVVGEHIAALCSRPSVWRGVMTIYVKSAPLRQELNMSRSTLTRILHEELGRTVINEIKFL